MKRKLFAPLLALVLAGALTACGALEKVTGEEKNVDLAGFYETLTQEENAPAMMPLEEDEFLEALYPGLSEIAAKQRIVATAAISSIAAELALTEVENEEDAAKVAEIFQARIDYQVGDGTSPGGAWYPETIRNWEQNAHIITHGNYVALIVWDDAGSAAGSFDALFA